MFAQAKTVPLISGSIATVTGEKVSPWSAKKTFQAVGNTSAGVGASTIGIEVSNDGTNYVEVDELSLTLGTTVTSDTFALDAAWRYVRAVVKTISGTDATVSVYMGFGQ